MESEEDVHYCMKCNTEIQGLMAYVEHCQSGCSAPETPVKVKEEKTSTGSDDEGEGWIQDQEFVVIDGETLAVDPVIENSPKKRGRKRKAASPLSPPSSNTIGVEQFEETRERPGNSPRRLGLRGIRISYADLAAGIDRSEAKLTIDEGKKEKSIVKVKAKSKGPSPRKVGRPPKKTSGNNVDETDGKKSTENDEAQDSSPQKIGRPGKKSTENDEAQDLSPQKVGRPGKKSTENDEGQDSSPQKVGRPAKKVAGKEDKSSKEKTEERQTLGQKVKLRAFKEKKQKSLTARQKLQAAAKKKLAAKKKGKNTKVINQEGEEEQVEANEVASSESEGGLQEDVAAMTEEEDLASQEALILIKDGKFYCTVCRIYCSSKKKIDVHCSTRKHRKRFKLGAVPLLDDDEKSPEDKVKGSGSIQECSTCSYRTRNPGHFARHMASIAHAQKSEVELHYCDKCHRKYKTVEELEAHQEFHSVPRCGKCKETFETEELLEQHREEMGHKIEHRCPVCEKTFSSKGNLRNHMNIHNPDSKFKCDICEYSCVQWADMKKHKYRHMGIKPFKCGLCEMQSLTKHGMERHMRTHLIRTKDYICDICGKGYCEEYLMKQHKYMKHNLDRRFPCDFEGCTFAFKFKSSLRTHMRMHTQEKPYLCSDCGYAASTKYGLTKHIRLHTGEKPFKCDFPNCNYKCRLSTHLSRHKIIHTGIKPYHCPFCLYSCNNKQNLRKHLLNTKSHSGLKMYKCKVCADYSTNVFRDYVIHIRKNHADDDKYISYFEVAESVTRKNERLAAGLKNEEGAAAGALMMDDITGENDLQSFSVVTVVPGKKGGKKRNVTIMDDREEVQKKLEEVILALEDHSAEVEAKAAEEASAENGRLEVSETVVPVQADNIDDSVRVASKEIAVGDEGQTIVVVPDAEIETEVCTTMSHNNVVMTTEGGESITQFVVEFDQQGRLVTEEDLAAATWLHNMGNIQDMTVEFQGEPVAEEVHQ